MTGPRPAEQPLHCAFEVTEPIATPVMLRVIADREHGMVEIVLGVSALKFLIAPDALERRVDDAAVRL